ncbi:hypothetical protein GF319_00700, partial [Candidatus Bathyarchaeota archaeon]|nr:hypothetical protein [Candidatus Bathyarchaeota archaeon]
MRPEERLVFTLSDPNFEETHEDKLGLPLEGLDWRFIVGRAIHERTFLAFTRNLSKLDEAALNKIPTKALRVMRKISYSFLGQKLVFYRELEEVFSELSGAGVIFMPMKGLLMNERVYPEDLRFFRDIDLLFPDTPELLKAEEVFRKLGYSSNSPTVNGVSYRKPISRSLIPT